MAHILKMATCGMLVALLSGGPNLISLVEWDRQFTENHCCAPGSGICQCSPECEMCQTGSAAYCSIQPASCDQNNAFQPQFLILKYLLSAIVFPLDFRSQRARALINDWSTEPFLPPPDKPPESA